MTRSTLETSRSRPGVFPSIRNGALRIAATVILCAASNIPALANQTLISREPAFSVGAWSGLRYTAPDGDVISCAVMTSVGNSAALAINIAPAGGLTISVSREGWKFPRGSVEIGFIIDDVTIATSADSEDGKVARVLFTAPDDDAVYERLNGGRLLKIDTEKGDQSYPLDGLEEAMPALARCAVGQSPTPIASRAPARQRPADPFDVPGATRTDKSEVMAIMANTMSKGEDDPKPTFLLADELARILPGYDVGWRDDTGVLVGTAVRGRVGATGVDAIIGNLLGVDAARCDGKMRIEIDPPEPAKGDTSTDIHAYCNGGGNGKEAHYLIYAYDNGGIMVTRLEPVSMKDPSRLIHEIYED